MLDSGRMMDISAVVEGLTHDVLRFLISLFEGIFLLWFRSIPAPGSRQEVLRFLDGFNTLFVGGLFLWLPKGGYRHVTAMMD